MTIYRACPFYSGTSGYKHNLRICNTYCFTSVTIVLRTLLSVPLYVHCLSSYPILTVCKELRWIRRISDFVLPAFMRHAPDEVSRYCDLADSSILQPAVHSLTYKSCKKSFKFIYKTCKYLGPLAVNMQAHIGIQGPASHRTRPESSEKFLLKNSWKIHSLFIRMSFQLWKSWNKDAGQY